jgi:hypothetical protein
MAVSYAPIPAVRGAAIEPLQSTPCSHSGSVEIANALDLESTAQTDPDRVKARTPGRQSTNFSRFSAFSAITGSAERKNSLQMRRFQTSEFSHSLDPQRPFACLTR